MKGAVYRPLVQKIVLWRRMSVQHGCVGMIAFGYLVDGENVLELRLHTPE